MVLGLKTVHRSNICMSYAFSYPNVMNVSSVPLLNPVENNENQFEIITIMDVFMIVECQYIP